MRRTSLRFVMAVSMAAISAVSLAAPVPLGLQITGTVALDLTYSLDPTGGATQAGTLTHISGGNPAVTSSFSGSPASISPSSLTGGLTQTGDRIGVNFSMSGGSTGAAATTDRLIADYTLSLSNTSATETFTVLFAAVFGNSVSANGADAFAQSSLSVRDASNIELFFTDHRIDTLNAGPANNFNLNSASNLFTVILAPGQSTILSAMQEQRGGVFAAGSYSASLDAFLNLQEIRSSGGGGNDIPLPGTVPLLLAGLLAMRLTQRRH